jgi:phage portal protein BeeE
MTRQVAGVFGVPIALLGLGSADAAKYANNYEQSRLAFWQDTIVPGYLKPTAAGLTAMLCPSGARIMYDLDAIPALWAGRAMLGATLSKVNCLTTDEKRDILGFKPEPKLPISIPVSGAEAGDPADDTADPPPTNPNADDNVIPVPRLVNGR